jgi:hypothetical protein
MNTITLTYTELVKTLVFLETFPVEGTQVTLVKQEHAGIGYTLEARVPNIELNNRTVTISTLITDESSW